MLTPSLEVCIQWIRNLLSGIAKMMEERFGRLGRLLGSLALLAAALGIIAWGIDQVWSKLVGPIWRTPYVPASIFRLSRNWWNLDSSL